MRQTRRILMILLLGGSILSALWGVCAQDRGLRSPTPVVPPEDSRALPSLSASKPGPVHPSVTQSSAPMLKRFPDPSEIIVTRGAIDVPSVTQADMKPVPEAMPALTPPMLTIAPAPIASEDSAMPPLTPVPGRAQQKVDTPSLPARGKTVIKAPAIAIPSATVEPQPETSALLQTPKDVADPARPRPFVLIKPKVAAEPVPTRAEVVPPTPVAPRHEAAPLPPSPEPRPPETTVTKAATPTPMPMDAAAPLLAVQTPHVIVEKRGPMAVRPGEPASYQLVVRNTGAVLAQQVRVEDELPGDARVLSGQPTPTIENGRAIWIIPGLAAGAQQTLSLSLQTTAAVDWVQRTAVSVSASAALQTAFSPQAPSSLAVRVSGPTAAQVNGSAVFDVTFTNQSRLTLNGLLLQAGLSSGLRHAMGQNIEAEIGNLEPATSRTIKLQTTALQSGRQQLNVRISTLAGAEAVGSATLDVGTASGDALTVQQPAVPRVFVGRESELRLVVTNTSSQPLRDIIVIDTLPEEVEYAGSSDRGVHQPINRTVHWLLEQLGPKQTQVLLLRVQGKSAGRPANEVVVRAGGLPEVKSSAALAVESVTELSLTLLGEDALEQGREAVYEVRLGNVGSAMLTGVNVKLELGEGLVPRNAQGPSRHKIDGQLVTFDGLPTLDAQGQAAFRVLALGQSAGDRRVRASVTSDQAPTPMTREKRTHVYRD